MVDKQNSPWVCQSNQLLYQSVQRLLLTWNIRIRSSSNQSGLIEEQTLTTKIHWIFFSDKRRANSGRKYCRQWGNAWSIPCISTLQRFIRYWAKVTRLWRLYTRAVVVHFVRKCRPESTLLIACKTNFNSNKICSSGVKHKQFLRLDGLNGILIVRGGYDCWACCPTRRNSVILSSVNGDLECFR